jgi:ribosomal protein L7/L12
MSWSFFAGLLALLSFQAAAIFSNAASSHVPTVKRLRRVEQKLDLILKHLGVEFREPDAGSDLPDDVRQLADAGQKIPAIKRLRELTGYGLKQAKDLVEEYLSRK